MSMSSNSTCVYFFCFSKFSSSKALRLKKYSKKSSNKMWILFEIVRFLFPYLQQSGMANTLKRDSILSKTSIKGMMIKPKAVNASIKNAFLISQNSLNLYSLKNPLLWIAFISDEYWIIYGPNIAIEIMMKAIL